MTDDDQSAQPTVVSDPTAQRMTQRDLLAQVRTVLSSRYDVRGVIGRGGMAVVFKARDPRFDRDVAIKVVRPELSAAIAADRFVEEIRITARLQHPHIVSLFDAGSRGDLLYYVMPLVEGESLRELIKREGRLPLQTALQLARELAQALDYAHVQGIVHRDVKPENVLLSSGQAMLADFGVARAAQHAVALQSATAERLVLGTPAYMSPEQGAGGAPVDGRSDIYSLGCVLYEMLGGEPPFSGPTPRATMARHVTERPPSIRVLRPDVPAEVEAAIEKMLAKVPGDRYRTARAVADALSLPELRSRSTAGLLAAAGVVAIGALALWSALLPSSSRLDVNKVAIFPLEERGLRASERGAGEAVAVMISTALEHADPIRPLDVQDRLSFEQRNDPRRVSAAARRHVAREVAALHYVTGIVQGYGDSITIGLRLYDVGADSLVDQQSVSGDRLRTPHHQMGIEAVRRLLPSLVDPGRNIDLAPLGRRDASAVALFIQGEREYRGSRFSRARDFYRRALMTDSALVIAAVKGALSAYWIEDHVVAAELARYAVARDTLLPVRYAAFARGLAAFSAGHADSAEIWLSRALKAAPGWPEALMQLGEVYYHLVPLRGALDSLAEAGFRAALASDSGFNPPLYHLSELAIRHNRLAEARNLVERLGAAKPTSEPLSRLQLMIGCVAAERNPFDWTTPVRSQPEIALSAGRALAAGGRHLACAEGAFRTVLALGPDSLHWGAALGLQSLLAAQGRTNELAQLVDSVVGAGTLPVLMTSYIVDVAADLPLDRQAAAVAQYGRRRWGPGYTALAAAPELDWLQWLYGVWHSKLGHRDTVEGLHRALMTAAARSGNASTALFAEALRAHARLLAGDTAEVVRVLRGLEPRVPNESLAGSLALPLAVERIKLAGLLLQRGDYEGAVKAASVFDQPEPTIYVAFLPVSLAIRSRAAEALGREKEAAGYRTRLRTIARARLARSSP